LIDYLVNTLRERPELAIFLTLGIGYWLAMTATVRNTDPDHAIKYERHMKRDRPQATKNGNRSTGNCITQRCT